MIELPARYDKLTPDQKREVREMYREIQEGMCWFCGEDLDDQPPPAVRRKKINWDLFPVGFLVNKVHLQHDHTTGKTEGVVHALCNAVLWQYHKR